MVSNVVSVGETFFHPDCSVTEGPISAYEHLQTNNERKEKKRRIKEKENKRKGE
jgi:hypothetical protein